MIIRSTRTQNFTIIPNLLLEDKKLDWKELGLLLFLLSKPDEWEVSVSHLAKQRKAGRDAILKSLKMLRDAGYVVMQRRHEGGVDYTIYDTPQNREKPKSGKTLVADESSEPKPEKPLTENPTMGKATNGKSGHIVNTETTTSTEKQEVSTERERSDFEIAARHVAKYLHHRLVQELPEAENLNPEKWVTDIERAIRIDGRTESGLIAMIDWMHTGDKFWVSNIQSGKKLRDKYLVMAGQMRRPKTHQKSTRRPGEFPSENYINGEVL